VFAASGAIAPGANTGRYARPEWKALSNRLAIRAVEGHSGGAALAAMLCALETCPAASQFESVAYERISSDAILSPSSPKMN
jgi:hypothetical protein